ncbi:MAG: glucose-6-phosphate isomerase [Buchnera aphidicola (Periphyllus acericola)]|uniref:glucose-6-phosphate isomerase n=1 Tax=Buchnera aphidicola TaxID=9 RepID=UPI0030D32AA9|nr:glucose-6-phosphate isomerase [Buchnera aphidicola (Periphyllus acericola)]
MKNINPTKTKFWNKLQKHYLKMKNVHLKNLFKNDLNRFKKFSLNYKNLILFDYSKNIINEKTIYYLINLAKECFLKESIKSMFNGDFINVTENQPVLHTLLRNFTKKKFFINGENISSDISKVFKKMKKFSNSIINKKWKGYTGKFITDVVNVGIGGSDLGPLMVTESLKPYKNHLKIHFISNIDGTQVSEVLKRINFETTIFLISSKTFTTQETMTNARTIRNYFLNEKNILKSDMSKHFFALSTNKNEAMKFGISKENFFPLWNWVGGRYSLWSAIGLSIMLSIGYKNFFLLLKGANSMDQHFLNTPFEKNIPVLMGLISIWYNNFFCSETEAILVYDQYMHKFATYQQQANMESNGKNIDRNKKMVSWQTGPIIWGESGTNGQHSFYQLIHQGTKFIPSDFIIPLKTHNNINDHHIKLLSHFFAQTRSLAFGKSLNELKNDYYESNNEKISCQKNNSLFYQVCLGNKPTNSFLIHKITPYTLGLLISLYEHKIFTQGVIFNIFSFDQWGVELGKNAAKKILSTIKKNSTCTVYDSSTNGLINFFKKIK